MKMYEFVEYYNGPININNNNNNTVQRLTCRVGSGNMNSLSNLPGLLRAGSIQSILLVAPMTTTSPRLSNPSIKASNVDTIDECI